MLLAVLIALALLLVSAAASAGRSAIAEQLFREGRTLMEGGDIDGACEKFAASMRAERSVGAYVNLARCHELQSKTATAHREYLEAARFAEGKGQADRADAARRFAAELEGKISTLTISVIQPVAGLTVLRNGERVPSESFGAPAYVDPGAHRVEANAPGHASWTRVVRVGPDGDNRRVEIPPLESTALDTPSTDKPTSDDSGLPRLMGWSLTGLGGAATLVGALLGITVLNDVDNAESDPALCPDKNCTAEGDAYLSDLEDRAMAANVLIPVGLAMVVSGVVLLAAIPDDAAASEETATSEKRGRSARRHLVAVNAPGETPAAR
jgi:hypothetical protein